jgi:creatinine amidohydrolase
MSAAEEPVRVRLAELTSPAIGRLLERPHVALLPVGSTEQHGPHLPLDVDIRLATALCDEAARAAGPDIAALVAPPLALGVSEHHMGFPGTLSLDAETFVAVLFQIGRSLVRHGFDRLLIVNGHAGNVGAIQVASAKLRLEGGARCVLFLSHWSLGGKAFASVRESLAGGTGHACEYETSLYLHVRPDLVDMDAAVCEPASPPFPGAPPLDLFVAPLFAAALGHDFSGSGVIGDPTLASAEKGRLVFDAEAAALAALVRDLALAP